MLTRHAGRLLVLAGVTSVLCACAACPTAPAGSGAQARAGCAKDVDCKGQRICERGQCVDPAPGSPGTLPRVAVGADGGPAPGATAAAAPTGGADLSPGPMFRGGPTRPGRSPFKGPASQPREKWRFKTGGPIFSTPVLSADGTTLFVGSHDRHVYAVNTADGQLRWRFVTGERVWSSPAVAADGTVYVGSDDDRLYALGAGGKVKWSFQLGPCTKVAVGPEATRCNADSSPVLGSDGTIYVGGDALYALKPDGTLKWRYAATAHCFSSPALAADGTVYIGCRDKRLHAVKPDGQSRWTLVVGQDVDSTPSLGKDGLVYVGADDHRLMAVSPDGQLKWAVSTLGDVRSSPAQDATGGLYVGSFDGRLYAIRPDGTVRWIYSTGKHIHSSPLVDADGNVHVGSQDGRLHVVSPDGTLRYTLDLDAEMDSSPVLGPDGTLYVAADDGTVRAYR